MTPPRATTMNINQMYINPAVVMMLVAIFMALIAVGGILWKFSMLLGDIKRDVAIVGERLDSHIKACELAKKTHS